MKNKFSINRAEVLGTLRSASRGMVLQGLLFWNLSEAEPWVHWGQGSVLVGLLFWASWRYVILLGWVPQEAGRKTP